MRSTGRGLQSTGARRDRRHGVDTFGLPVTRKSREIATREGWRYTACRRPVPAARPRSTRGDVLRSAGRQPPGGEQPFLFWKILQPNQKRGPPLLAPSVRLPVCRSFARGARDMTRSTIPTGLSLRGRRLWRELHAEFELDAGEDQVAIELVRLLSLSDRIDVALAVGALLVKGSREQDVANPLIAARIKNAEAIGRLTARLSLPDRDKAVAAASQLGRLGARRRWHHPKARSA